MIICQRQRMAVQAYRAKRRRRPWDGTHGKVKDYLVAANQASARYMKTQEEEELTTVARYMKLATEEAEATNQLFARLPLVGEFLDLTWPLILHYPVSRITTKTRLHIYVCEPNFPVVRNLLLRFWPNHVRCIQILYGRAENLQAADHVKQDFIWIDDIAPLLHKTSVEFLEVFDPICFRQNNDKTTKNECCFPNIRSFAHRFDPRMKQYCPEQVAKWFPNLEWFPTCMLPIHVPLTSTLFPRLKYASLPTRPMELWNVHNLVYLHLASQWDDASDSLLCEKKLLPLFEAPPLQQSLQKLELEGFNLSYFIDVLKLLPLFQCLDYLVLKLNSNVRRNQTGSYDEERFLCIQALFRLHNVKRLFVRDLIAAQDEFKQFMEHPPRSLIMLDWQDAYTYKAIKNVQFRPHIQVPFSPLLFLFPCLTFFCC